MIYNAILVSGIKKKISGFRKGKGTRDQIANIRWVIEKSKRISEKHLLH